MGSSTRIVRGRGMIATSALVFALAPAIARADYTGSVGTGDETVTLTGSGPVDLSTSGGFLHHGNLGSGFVDGTDFDSNQDGDQTVPDASGWTITVNGGGSDPLEIDEGEATNPVTYELGHIEFPTGNPCVVRAPVQFPGVYMAPDPPKEVTVCYAGMNKVTVRPGTGSIQYGVLDTETGVPLYLYGGSGGEDELTESADVPAEVGDEHNAESPVYFIGGSGPAAVAYDDDQGSTAETYSIGNGEMTKTGRYPLYYSQLATGSIIELYPQQGPSTINIGSTGGVPVQIFGNFFGQTGPDTINGAKADAQLLVTGSLGSDKITTSPVAGGYYAGGGGNPTIYATDNPGTQIDCNPGGPAKGTVFAVKADQISDCASVNYPTTKLVLSHLSFKSGRVKKGARLTLRTPNIAAGRLTLTYKLHQCTRRGHKRRCGYKAVGTRWFNVKAESSSLSFSSQASEGRHHRLKKLSAGTYRISIVLAAGKLKSNTVTLALKVR